MRTVLQRVSRASVSVEGAEVASIGSGLCLLVGVAPADGPHEVDVTAGKVAGLRIFPDEEGRMNRSISDVGGEILVVSQFTLLGDVKKGRRPSFAGAAGPERAEPLIGELVAALRLRGIPTSEGVFGAHMVVELVNDGPVTLVLDVTDGTVG